MRRPELCFQRRYELQIRCTTAQLMRVDGARKVRWVQTRGGHVPNGNNRGARGIVAATRQTPKWGASRYRTRIDMHPRNPSTNATCKQERSPQSAHWSTASKLAWHALPRYLRWLSSH